MTDFRKKCDWLALWNRLSYCRRRLSRWRQMRLISRRRLYNGIYWTQISTRKP